MVILPKHVALAGLGCYPLVGHYFGHDGSYYSDDCRRTKHHPMIKQTVPESLDCQENVDANSRIVG